MRSHLLRSCRPGTSVFGTSPHACLGGAEKADDSDRYDDNIKNLEDI